MYLFIFIKTLFSLLLQWPIKLDYLTPGKDKHCSLLIRSVGDGAKSFIALSSCKLECFFSDKLFYIVSYLRIRLGVTMVGSELIPKIKPSPGRDRHSC